MDNKEDNLNKQLTLEDNSTKHDLLITFVGSIKVPAGKMALLSPEVMQELT